MDRLSPTFFRRESETFREAPFEDDTYGDFRRAFEHHMFYRFPRYGPYEYGALKEPPPADAWKRQDHDSKTPRIARRLTLEMNWKAYGEYPAWHLWDHTKLSEPFEELRGLHLDVLVLDNMTYDRWGLAAGFGKILTLALCHYRVTVDTLVIIMQDNGKNGLVPWTPLECILEQLDCGRFRAIQLRQWYASSPSHAVANTLKIIDAMADRFESVTVEVLETDIIFHDLAALHRRMSRWRRCTSFSLWVPMAEELPLGWVLRVPNNIKRFHIAPRGYVKAPDASRKLPSELLIWYTEPSPLESVHLDLARFKHWCQTVDRRYEDPNAVVQPAPIEALRADLCALKTLSVTVAMQDIPNALPALTAVVKQSKSLRHLKLMVCDRVNDDVETGSIASLCCACRVAELHTLHLDGIPSPLGREESAYASLSWLTQSRSLRELHISLAAQAAPFQGTFFVPFLAKWLCDNRSLEILSLEFSSHLHGTIDLFEALAHHNRTLRVLRLHVSDMPHIGRHIDTEEFDEALRAIYQHNKTLQLLQLTGSTFDRYVALQEADMLEFARLYPLGADPETYRQQDGYEQFPRAKRASWDARQAAYANHTLVFNTLEVVRDHRLSVCVDPALKPLYQPAMTRSNWHQAFNRHASLQERCVLLVINNQMPVDDLPKLLQDTLFDGYRPRAPCPARKSRKRPRTIHDYASHKATKPRTIQ